jgi:hypothetical protein
MDAWRDSATADPVELRTDSGALQQLRLLQRRFGPTRALSETSVANDGALVGVFSTMTCPQRLFHFRGQEFRLGSIPDRLGFRVP